MLARMLPNLMLWALYVSAFLAQVQPSMNFAMSFPRLARPPALRCCTLGGAAAAQPSARSCKTWSVIRELRMSFGSEEPGFQDAECPRSDTASPARGRHAWGSGKTGARRGEVLRVKPAADNSWHETRKVVARESTFVHALMYKWPTSWLRTERHLNQLARVLRDEAPVSVHESDKEEDEASKSEAEDRNIPFDVGGRYRVAGQAGPIATLACFVVASPLPRLPLPRPLPRNPLPRPPLPVISAACNIGLSDPAVVVSDPKNAWAGQGAFSVVKTGRDLRSDQQVAIKRLQDAAPDAAQVRRLMRELAMLRRARGHSNIMEIRDILVKKRKVPMGFFKPPRDVTDVYIITELMMSDLGRMLDHDTTLTTEQARCLMFQLLQGLQHIHDTGIMHRDIKPSNCLVDKMWRLKICDLGIARESSREPYVGSIYQDPDAKFTDYVVTRPYRSPELLMGSRMYDGSVDMWSAGCILAELLAGQEPVEVAPMARDTTRGRIRLPLFPGADHKDMVKRIVSVLGHPTEDELKFLGKWEPKAVRFVEAQPYPHCDLETKREVYGVESVGDHCTIPTMAPCNPDEETCPVDPVEQKPVEWCEVFPWADKDALDLLKRLLQYDASKRPTAAQALAHRFFAKAAPPLEPGQRTSELDVDTAFKRAALRSSSPPVPCEGSGAPSKPGVGFYDRFWEECDERIWRAPGTP